MNSNLGLPFVDSFLPQVPVIAKSICDEISFLVDHSRTNWVAGVVESFDFVPGLVVPEVNNAVGSCGHEPFLVDGVE